MRGEHPGKRRKILRGWRLEPGGETDGLGKECRDGIFRLTHDQVVEFIGQAARERLRGFSRDTRAVIIRLRGVAEARQRQAKFLVMPAGQAGRRERAAVIAANSADDGASLRSTARDSLEAQQLNQKIDRFRARRCEHDVGVRHGHDLNQPFREIQRTFACAMQRRDEEG